MFIEIDLLESIQSDPIEAIEIDSGEELELDPHLPELKPHNFSMQAFTPILDIPFKSESDTITFISFN